MNLTEREPIVWIIDSEHWPRACLRAELIERGCDAVGFTDVGQCLEALNSPRAKRPRVIVFELREQALTPSVLAALANAAIPIIALGGASEISDPPVSGFKWAALLRRPVTLGAVANAVETILRQSSTGAY